MEWLYKVWLSIPHLGLADTGVGSIVQCRYKLRLYPREILSAVV